MVMMEMTNQKVPELEAEEMSNMFRIPPEIRAKIFVQLNPKNLLQIRLTNSVLNALIDHYLGVNVYLTEISNQVIQSDVLEFFGRVALSDVRIGDMTCIMKDNTSCNLNSIQYRFEDIFFYPQFVRNLMCEGEIHIQLIRGILLNCINLQSFDMIMGCKFSGGCLLPEVAIDLRKIFCNQDGGSKNEKRKFIIHLPKLKSLKLFLINSDEKHLNTEMTLCLIHSIRSYHLKRFIFQCWVTTQYGFVTISLLAAKFVKQNPHLDSFFMGLLYNDIDGSEEETDLELTEQQSQQLQLELLNIGQRVQLRRFGLAAKAMHLLHWLSFCQVQTKLEHLSLTIHAKVGFVCEQTFQNSSSTLRQLFIRADFHDVFDLSSLADCKMLKELCLHNTIEHPVTIPLLVNFAYIPQTLVSLILFNVIIASEDITTTIQTLHYLQTLVLFKTGKGAGTGVNGQCLRQIFWMRSLKSVLIVRFIATSEDEAVCIIKMLEIQEGFRDDFGLSNEDEVTAPAADPPAQNDVHDQDDENSGISSSSINSDSTLKFEYNSILDLANSSDNGEANTSSNFDTNAPTIDNFDKLKLGVEEDLGRVFEEAVKVIDSREGKMMDNPSEIPLISPVEGDDFIQQSSAHTVTSVVDLTNSNGVTLPNDILFDDGNENAFGQEVPNNDEDHEIQFDELFENEIPINAFDLNGVLPADVHVTYVIDTILDILTPDFSQSQWVRTQDAEGNTTFTLRISLEDS